jgi:hypothetical protein
MPISHLTPQSPIHVQALASRIFHPNRHAIAPRIIDLKGFSIQQAFAAKVPHFDHQVIEPIAPKVVHFNCHDLAPSVFHLNHLAIGQSLAPVASSANLDKVDLTWWLGLFNFEHFVPAHLGDQSRE